ncbi:hypothetical protein NQ318_021008 [Aromia moschata]|uniref:Uncharacterized protein n=1 Tax=Aromia moschata TaxID=1265417 RepID=A0AAV8YQ68_9CUCU|nr:hypothetical protein NQ318_021008 [Aromia moschata]
MASDTERLTEIDIDDTVSVAQSDDTNSVARSDDTRSETDENMGSIRRLSSSSNSYVTNPLAQNYVSTVTVSSSTNYGGPSTNPFLTNGNVNNINYLPALPTLSSNAATSTTDYVTSSNFQEYSKVDIKNDRINGKTYRHGEHVDNNANTVFKSLTLNNSEHSLTFSDSSAKIKSSVFNTSSSTVTTVISKIQNSVPKESDLSVLGPSGLNKKLNNVVEAKNEYLKQSRNIKKYEDRPNEILLSNSSLNSSSSGSSSNSFENKNSHNENSEQWENKQWLNSSGSSLNVTLTPSESTSELSVLSVNNISNPNFETVCVYGAIPKSISFDMSADKGLDDDSRSKRGGFFGKLRIGFKNRNRGKTFRNQEDYRLDGDDYASSKKLSESPVKINSTVSLETKYRYGVYTDLSVDIDYKLVIFINKTRNNFDMAKGD